MSQHRIQLTLPDIDPGPTRSEDERVHDWYRFVLGYPPSLVRDYLAQLELGRESAILDPFCGTGTTLIECKKARVPSVGIEANPMAHFACRVKLDWSPDPAGLREHARGMAARAAARLEEEGLGDGSATLGPPASLTALRTLPADAAKLLLTDSISPLPLHRTLALLECMDEERDEAYRDHELLALARVLPTEIGNLRFGPEVGLGRVRADSPVVDLWLQQVHRMADDLEFLQDRPSTPVTLVLGDARDVMACLKPRSVSGVITSPPYPNEKDYTRIVRLEAVLLGFLSHRADLRALKNGLLRSNTRNVYKGDDDHDWVAEFPEVQRIADKIEARRVAMGKDSGFERQYARVTRLYFGGMARHFAGLREALQPGARLAYVVGDQASYLRVMIRTGQLLAQIAESLGYEVLDIELFRTRMATATKAQLREEVVLLRWPGA